MINQRTCRDPQTSAGESWMCNNAQQEKGPFSGLKVKNMAHCWLHLGVWDGKSLYLPILVELYLQKRKLFS